MKIPPNGSRVIPCGRTDRHDDVFRFFEKASKNKIRNYFCLVPKNSPSFRNSFSCSGDDFRVSRQKRWILGHNLSGSDH